MSLDICARVRLKTAPQEITLSELAHLIAARDTLTPDPAAIVAAHQKLDSVVSDGLLQCELRTVPDGFSHYRVFYKYADMRGDDGSRYIPDDLRIPGEEGHWYECSQNTPNAVGVPRSKEIKLVSARAMQSFLDVLGEPYNKEYSTGILRDWITQHCTPVEGVAPPHLSRPKTVEDEFPSKLISRAELAKQYEFAPVNGGKPLSFDNSLNRLETYRAGERGLHSPRSVQDAVQREKKGIWDFRKIGGRSEASSLIGWGNRID